jgi:hypothetical protein
MHFKIQKPRAVQVLRGPCPKPQSAPKLGVYFIGKPALAATYPHLPQLGEINPARPMDVGREGLLYD